jgi:hypothetical protein
MVIKKSQMKEQMERINTLTKNESKQKIDLQMMLEFASKLPTDAELHRRLDAQYEQHLLGDLRLSRTEKKEKLQSQAKFHLIHTPIDEPIEE